jgi:hypothetical protein
VLEFNITGEAIRAFSIALEKLIDIEQLLKDQDKGI